MHIKSFRLEARYSATGLIHLVPQFVEWKESLIYNRVEKREGKPSTAKFTIRAIAPDTPHWILALTTNGTEADFQILKYEVCECVFACLAQHIADPFLDVRVVDNCPQFVARTLEVEATKAYAASQAVLQKAARAKGLAEADARKMKKLCDLVAKGKKEALDAAATAAAVPVVMTGVEEEDDGGPLTLAQLMQLCCA